LSGNSATGRWGLSYPFIILWATFLNGFFEQYFVRSTRSVLPALFGALAPGTDPDRMKGALYLLWDKGIGVPLSSLQVSIF
jgi:hypothetical protein